MSDQTSSNQSEPVISEKNLPYTVEDFLLDGLSQNLPDKHFDPDQLNQGIEVELEHTQNYDLAKKIAKDHLVEFPDYYTRLEKMEKEAKKFWTKEKYTQTCIGQYLSDRTNSS